MAKIIFYADEVSKLVEDFMNKIHENGSTKTNFIDSVDIEKKTKITPTEDKMTTISTALTTIGAFIQDLIILYPISVNTPLPAMVDNHIKEEQIENVSVAIMCFKEDNMDCINGMEYITLDPSTTEITESTFIPDVKKILYLMTAERAKEIIDKIETENNSISIANGKEFVERFGYDEKTNISVMIPQLFSVSWIDFFSLFEVAVDNDPFDVVYLEYSETTDFFLNSIITVLEKKFPEGSITYRSGDKSYIELVKQAVEEEDIKITPVEDNTTPVVDVEPEVVTPAEGE